MAGRPKRLEEVTSILLRIPPYLLARVTRYKAKLELQEGISLTRTDALLRIIAAGCEALEETVQDHEAPALAQRPISEISEISPRSESEIAARDGDDMPGYDFHDEEGQTPQPQDVPALAAPAQDPLPPPAATGIRDLPPHIQRIAEARAEYERMSLAEFSQLLFDREIYRAKDRKTGEEKPVNRGTLQHWLDQAGKAGLL